MTKKLEKRDCHASLWEARNDRGTGKRDCHGLPEGKPHIYEYRFLMSYFAFYFLMDSSSNFHFKTLGLRIGLRNFELYKISFLSNTFKETGFVTQFKFSSLYPLSASKTFSQASNDWETWKRKVGIRSFSRFIFCIF